ncbi:MAG: SPL family radical SAM protein [Candidatus Saccharicenans sp.]
MIKIKEIQAKSILNESKIFDYCLNPYTGCSHGCRYCYAGLFMRRYSGHEEPWGQFVDIKSNAPKLLSKQLPRARKGPIWISSVCDAYQPIELRYQITRQCLKEISRYDFPVFIQTKSDLVIRDLDIFSTLKELEIGFSIATDDDKIASLFEPGAPSISRRIKALETIKKKNIKTFVFIGPILPQNPERLIELIRGLADKIFIDRLNYREQFINFYRRYNLEYFSQENYFNLIKNRLISAIQKTNLEYEVLF